MTHQMRCSGCGAALTTEAPQGLCPACLLKCGFESRSAGGDTSLPPTPGELADRFPELEILELIGRGGMGAVYKARQKRLDRLVALKILPPNVSLDPTFADRFEREARALAKLDHQNIVTLFEFGQADGLFYFLMEFVDGVNLRRLLDAGKLVPKEALAIVPQICDALQFAHDRGIVHRDIKPENVLLGKDGRVKIADFGVAKIVGAGVAETTADVEPVMPAIQLTEAGRVIGTPHYMAPEQHDHPANVDHRADIYSLGVVFYQMLTGELPGKRIEVPSRKVLIDVRLDEVVLRALEKEPERRYQHASVLKTQVETIASEMGSAETSARGTLSKGSPSGWARMVARMTGVTFTSPKACRCANFSALGFLGFLGLLGNLPVAGSQYLYGLFGCFGLFGLIGNAAGIEFRDRQIAEMKKVLADPNASPVVHLDGPLTLEAWLAFVDAENYARSWDTAAPNLRVNIGREAWIARMQEKRQPLGKVLARRLKDTRLTKLGVVFEAVYAASFEGMPAATETVAFTKQPDGQWQPSGYFVEQAEPDSDFNSRRLQIFAVLSAVLFLLLVALNNAEAMMIGSVIWLLAGLIWFSRGNLRKHALLVAMASLGIGGAVAILLIGKAKHPSPAAVSLGEYRLAINRVSADQQKVVIEGVALADAWISFYAGQPGNGWSCGFARAGRFTASLEQGLTGLKCRVLPEIGKPALTIDGTKEIGDLKLSEGELVFRAGQPYQDSDGVWSAIIGEWTAKSGERIPIGVALKPPPPEVFVPQQLIGEGWELWQARKLTGAEAKFEQVLHMAPDNANAWNGLGWTQFNSGKFAEAERSFLEATSNEPEQPGALNGLGQLYLSQRKYDDAEKFLLKASPQASAAWFGLARLYLLEGKFEQAKKWAQNIVDSGQADDIAKKMLEAAGEGKLSDPLRQLIEPPTIGPASQTPREDGGVPPRHSGG